MLRATLNMLEKLKNLEETNTKGDDKGNKNDKHDETLALQVAGIEYEIEYHSLSDKELQNVLSTDLEEGLTEEEAAKRLEENGLNILKDIKDTKPIHQSMTNLLSWLPFVCMTNLIFAFFDIFVLEVLFSGYYDRMGVYIGIFTIYIIYVFTPVLFSNPSHLDIVKILKQNYLIPHEAGVIRDSTLYVIESAKIVRGDIILLAKDDIVPADIRLTFSDNLKTRRPNSDEIITHTAEVNSKSVRPHKNIVSYGHKIEDGFGMGVVIATGLNTQIGELNKMVYKMQKPTPKSEYFRGIVVLVLLCIIVGGSCYIICFVFDKFVLAFLKHFVTKFDASLLLS